MNLPGDWPCCKCSHLNGEHGPCLYSDGDLRGSDGCRIRKISGGYADPCQKFEPISNLEYLERKYASLIS